MENDQNDLIYLSLGSKLGDRKKNLEDVENLLPPEILVRDSSQIYEPEPWGYLDQSKFLKQVLVVQSSLPPNNLLAYLKNIERSFVLVPLAEVAPELILPGTESTVINFIETVGASDVNLFQE